jgi:hypothetical protein
MNKFSIALLSIICCSQQTYSMEKQQIITSSSDDIALHGYHIERKRLSDYPEQTPISTEFNALSEKLYNPNITDPEIRELVQKGAELNYQRKGDTFPLAICYAYHNLVKQMATIIGLKAPIHNLKDISETPLSIALALNGSSTGKDYSEMIQLLIPHENPTVTIYEGNHKDIAITVTISPSNGADYTFIPENDLEQAGCKVSIQNTESQQIRELLIENSFENPNITTIKMLLDHKLMTAHRGLKEFVHHEKPNKEILDLLISYGANNISDIILQLMSAIAESKEIMRSATHEIKNVMNNLESLKK